MDIKRGTVVRLTIGLGICCESEGSRLFERYGNQLGVVSAFGSNDTYWVWFQDKRIRGECRMVRQFKAEDIEPIADGRRCRRGKRE